MPIAARRPAYGAMPYLLALILLVVSASASAETARVIDGDTLELAGEGYPPDRD
jgi:endonuclease YncB( thermonuclease family)